VINFIWFQGEDLAKSSSDLILQSHGFEGSCSVDLTIDMRSCYDNWVKVIVSELTSSSSSLIGVSKDSPVGVPLSDGWTVSDYCLFDRYKSFISKDFSVFDFCCCSQRRFEGLVSKNVGSVGFQGQSWKSTNDWISMEHLCSFENLCGGLSVLQEVDGILGELVGLVSVFL